jgi:predicted RNase H-like nuclease (RuvC/YqgF family)
MKRQYKPVQVAKREVKQLKKELKNKSDWETGYNDLLQLFSHVREYNGELRAEIWEVNKVNNQLENELDRISDLCNYQSITFQEIVNEDFKTIKALRKDLDKSNKWLLASSIGLLVTVSYNVIGYFI